VGIVGNAISAAKSLEADMAQRGDLIDCEIELSEGDWGGQMMLVSVSPAAAVLIARQLLQLAEREVEGAHVNIDRASIAPGAKHQLRIALRNFAKVGHA
jgi:hypothetical protein